MWKGKSLETFSFQFPTEVKDGLFKKAAFKGKQETLLLGVDGNE